MDNSNNDKKTETSPEKPVKARKFTSVELSKIDPDIIKDIRKLNTNKTSYTILEKSIAMEGQHHPITLRILTEKEKQKSNNKEAVYGIVDGHLVFILLKKEMSKKYLQKL